MNTTSIIVKLQELKQADLDRIKPKAAKLRDHREYARGLDDAIRVAAPEPGRVARGLEVGR